MPGVARVEISGAPPNEVEIAIDPDRLTAHNLGLNELDHDACRRSISRCRPGEINEGGRRLRVQPVGEITRPAASCATW